MADFNYLVYPKYTFKGKENESVAVPSLDEIHVWVIDLAEGFSSCITDTFDESLSVEETKQKDQFAFQTLKRRYLLTRGLVRSVFSSYMPEYSPQEWQFEKTAYGRPYCVMLEPKLTFNISHNDNLVLLAVGRDGRLGIDVEARSGTFVEDIARQNFAPLEYHELMCQPLEFRADRFYALWTLKEAYIKALGLGLSTGLDDFSFSFLQDGQIHFTPKEKGEEWHASLYQQEENFVSICVDGCKDRPNYHFYNVSEKDKGRLSFNRYFPELRADNFL